MNPQAPSQLSSEYSVPQNEKQWAMFSHLSSLSALLGFPLGNIFGPLIMYLIKKDEMPFGAAQAKEALNFNLSLFLYGIVSGILVLLFIGILLLGALFIIWIVFTIIGAVKANNGEFYRYPMTIRFVS